MLLHCTLCSPTDDRPRKSGRSMIAPTRCPFLGNGDESGGSNPLPYGWRGRPTNPVGAAISRPRTTLLRQPLRHGIRRATADCQVSATLKSKTSLADFHPRQALGRSLMSCSTKATSSSETLVKSVPLGKKNRTISFMFSLEPRCQGL